MSLEDFHIRWLRPGESLSVFLHELKQLLDQAMPEAEAATRTQLVLHQFITGLPVHFSKQLRASGEVSNLHKVLERTQLLLTIEKQKKSAAIEAKEELFKVEALREQISALTEQVSALVTRCPATRPNRPRLCYRCHQPGHPQRQCPKSRGCFVCGCPCSQELSAGKRERGILSGPGTPHAQVSPPSVFNVVVAAVRPSAAVLKERLGDIEVKILLDSSATISLVRNSIRPRTLGVKQLKPGDLQLVSAAGERMLVVGQANLVVQVGN